MFNSHSSGLGGLIDGDNRWESECAGRAEFMNPRKPGTGVWSQWGLASGQSLFLTVGKMTICRLTDVLGKAKAGCGINIVSGMGAGLL